MKLFTMFIVMAIWVFIAVYLPTNIIPFNPFMGIYLIAIIWFSLTKGVDFFVWNLYSEDTHEMN